MISFVSISSSSLYGPKLQYTVFENRPKKVSFYNIAITVYSNIGRQKKYCFWKMRHFRWFSNTVQTYALFSSCNFWLYDLVKVYVNMALKSLLITINAIISSTAGWRLGLQQITGLLITTFLLGTFYRSASLYHPQRRAILHLKTQKRKIKNKDKEKNKLQDDRPPFFEFTTLRSRTVQIILLSTFLSHVGIFTPLFLLVSPKDKIRLPFKVSPKFQRYLCKWGCTYSFCNLLRVKNSWKRLAFF